MGEERPAGRHAHDGTGGRGDAGAGCAPPPGGGLRVPDRRGPGGRAGGGVRDPGGQAGAGPIPRRADRPVRKRRGRGNEATTVRDRSAAPYRGRAGHPGLGRRGRRILPLPSGRRPVPSEVDRTFMALWPDMIWVIVGATPDGAGPRVRAWRLDSLGKEKDPTEVRILPRRRTSGDRCATRSDP